MPNTSEDRLHHALLEEDVEERLRELRSPRQALNYEHRLLKAAQFRSSPVQILARRKRTRHSPCYMSPDLLANLLSLLLPAVPSRAFTGIRQILLLPEFNSTECYFLTHLYSRRDEILAIYLYPRRLDEVDRKIDAPSGEAPASRLHRSLGSRLPLETKARGILERVLKDIALLPKTPDLHTWLYPLEEISAEEKRQLRFYHELYAS